MSKGMRHFFLAMVFVFLAIGAIPAEAGIKLKLFGGASFWSTGGDFKPLFDSTAARYTYVGYTGTFDLTYTPWAFEGGLQGLFEIAPNLDLGLSAGYLFKAWNQKPQLSYSWGPGTWEADLSYKVSGIPLSLDLQYGIPLGAARFNLYAGGDVFLGRVSYNDNEVSSEPNRTGKPNWKWAITETFAADKSAVGFHGGVGLELRLSGTVSLCVDAFYRVLNMTDIKGTHDFSETVTWTGSTNSDSTHSDSSFMWFSTSNVWGNTWHYLDFGDTRPTTSDSSRTFKIDLGGPVFRIGLKFGL